MKGDTTRNRDRRGDKTREKKRWESKRRRDKNNKKKKTELKAREEKKMRATSLSLDRGRAGEGGTAEDHTKCKKHG